MKSIHKTRIDLTYTRSMLVCSVHYDIGLHSFLQCIHEEKDTMAE